MSLAVANGCAAVSSRVSGARDAVAAPSPLCAPGSKGLCNLAPAWRSWIAANPEEREEVLRYAVQCALPEGSDVAAPGGVLHGNFGLRPGWRDEPLSVDDQQVVSACLLAHLNAFGAHVTIAIAGPDVPFPAPNGFRYMEGVFFGNLFESPSTRAACSGTGDGSGGDAVGRAERVCTKRGARCGLDAVGPCTGEREVGCLQWGGALPHRYCMTAADYAGRLYRHPITVYLRSE
ncbi:MAG TPA: hypothetical protein VGL81_11130 [Polyangiaceae bacterium]